MPEEVGGVFMITCISRVKRIDSISFTLVLSEQPHTLHTGNRQLVYHSRSAVETSSDMPVALLQSSTQEIQCNSQACEYIL